MAQTGVLGNTIGGFGSLSNYKETMSLIYLRHPQHGEKIASMELEAENDEQNGWTRYTIDTPTETVEVVEEQPESVVEVVNTLKPKTRRKSA